MTGVTAPLDEAHPHDARGVVARRRARRARPGSSRWRRACRPACRARTRGRSPGRRAGSRRPEAVGLPSGPASCGRASSKISRPGVNGLRGSKRPMPGTRVLSLQRPGSPVPDSSTQTLKLCWSPRNAMSVGKVQVPGEHFDLEAARHDDVLAVARVVVRGFFRADRVGGGLGERCGCSCDSCYCQQCCDLRWSERRFHSHLLVLSCSPMSDAKSLLLAARRRYLSPIAARLIKSSEDGHFRCTASCG